MTMEFDRSLDAPAGMEVRLSPLVSRLLAPNPGPFTFKGTGVHFLGAGDSIAVIDPGPDMTEHLEALKQAIGMRRVSHILVTHTHRDHSPAARILKAWSGAPIYAFPPQYALADEREGVVDEAVDHDFAPDVALSDGALIGGADFTIECLHTPGHMLSHMCFALREEQALFCGDHVMGWSTSVVAPPDGNMGQYLTSLEQLIARGDRILYPTHGSPIVQPQDYMRDLLAHRHMREAQIISALARGGDTVPALVERLYPGLDVALLAAAASQVQAHLDHLAEKHEVTAQSGRYWLTASTA
jgi:glyoxylase-like metal-dependent hydrolase (beta-lactamase superfamily II)